MTYITGVKNTINPLIDKKLQIMIIAR